MGDISRNRIPAAVFLKDLSKTNSEFFFLAGFFRRADKKVGRVFLNYLRREAHGLETILDDAEAFTNELFFFRELMAGIRWFCRAAFTLEEGVISRYDNRRLKECPGEKEKLLAEATGCLEYFYRSVRNLCGEALDLADRYGVVPPPEGTSDSYIKLQVQPRLEKNRSVTSPATQVEAVEILTSEFIGVSETLAGFQERLLRNESTINEKSITQILNGFHALESFYDTHIQGTELEKREPDFLSLRGYIAMGLRFFEMLQDLVHFYERHMLQANNRALRNNFNRLVDEAELVRVIDKFGLTRGAQYSRRGAALALELLTRCTGKVRRAVQIPVGVDGIHARPMTWIYKVSRRYGPVTFEVGGEKFQADSMLSMLTMTEAIDRVIGLSDKEGQIAVATGTVINELEKRKESFLVERRRYTPAGLIQVLEKFRAEIRDKAGTRFVEIIASGPGAAIDDIEIMASNCFKKELLPERLSYLFDESERG